LSLLLFSLALSGCSTSEASAPSGAGSGAERAITEADIIQLDGGRLYAMSRSGTVSVVDVSAPGTLTLLGQTHISGQPFEMYRRGDFLVAMSNGAVLPDGTTALPATSDEAAIAPDPNAGSLVTVLDVHDPANLTLVSSLAVPGELADSRIVGDVLYLATYENAACFGCGDAPRTMVTSFDVSNLVAMKPVDQARFESNAPDGYNLPWGTNWKRSIFVTDQRLYIGGHADIDPDQFYATETTQSEGIIDVLDITDPGGHLVPGARITVAGAILSRWQVDERDGILRVISQQGAGRTGNGIGMPRVNTFRIDSTQSFVPLGETSIQLPMQEGLRTVRFDADRAYAITYNQTDPLFAIDLSDPTAPAVRGELKMPGFMFYLEPHGDRLIGLGIDRTDPEGSMNVSLFDVSDLSEPTMLGRASFAGAGFTEDYEILNGELPEDQDRIQKAFHVFEDGLVAVPFSTAAGCGDTGSGVQLVSWKDDTLTKRALLPLPGNPRRAFENGGEILTLSDSNVRSFGMADLDSAEQTADLTIGTCVERSAYYGGQGWGGWWGCALAAPGTSSGAPGAAAVALGAIAVALGRRRARRA
jgi:hypothetical protein